LHWLKEYQRGFNQSELLARLIAQNLNKNFSNSALKRPKKAQQQKQLNSVERHKNLKNAFKANSKIVADKKILLIDDVFTTGATLDNAAIILKKAGATAVYVLTIGRA
jgi:ComF family protein